MLGTLIAQNVGVQGIKKKLENKQETKDYKFMKWNNCIH
jgi:hypothetical protein